MRNLTTQLYFSSLNNNSVVFKARSPFVLKHTTSYRASEASEILLGVDNAKSGICYMYICMWDGTYAL